MSIMHMSKTYCPTLKEDPAGADIASHRLLLRAGMIRQMGSGTYTFLPLGMNVLNKVQDIVLRGDERDRRSGNSHAHPAAGRVVARIGTLG